MAVAKITLPETVEQNIILLLQDRSAHFPRDKHLRALRKFDRAYHMEAARNEDEDFNSRYENVDVAIVNPNATADHTFYSDTFLSSSPIFSAVSSAANMDAAKATDGKIEKDQREFNWVAELSQTLQNVAKFNRGFAEVKWRRKKVTKIGTDTNNENNTDISSVFYEGNSIKNIDLYNAMWDTSVPISKLAEKGEFFAYTDLLTQVALYSELQELSDEEDEILKVPDEMWQSTTQNAAINFGYEVPDIAVDPDDSQTKKGETDWYAHLGIKNQEGKYADNKRYYQRTVLYAKIIPAAYGMTATQTPKPHLPQVFKFVIINNQFVVYAERETDLHNYLPVLGCTAIEDSTNWQTKSPAAMTMKHQTQAKMLQDRYFALLDRLIGDRGLYDPQRVSAESISSGVPDAKIPARPSALNGLQGVYQQIPFNPGNFGFLQDSINNVKISADETAGINKAQQGQFVKGNKTLGEWNDVMDSATGKSFSRALYMQSTFFVTLKYLLKSNMFQYQTTEDVYSEAEKEVVTVNPADIRSKVLDFRLTDGLKSAAKMLNSGGMEFMIELMLRNPQFGMEFSVGRTISHLLMQGKGVDIRDYRLTPEEKEQQLAQMQAQQEQQGPGGQR